MNKRFKNWEPPKFDENNLTKWNWMCQNHKNLELGKDVDIGAFTYINAKYGVLIEDSVQIGSHCSIYSISTIDNKKGKIILKKNCKIGTHSVIMPGVVIGKNSVIGAFSFVNKNIPDNAVAYGVPAKIKNKIIGITPARGGSKGIYRKNIKMIAGKPLIAWTIEKSFKSKLIDQYVVSTEDKEIAKIATDYNAKVIMRPSELATDKSLVIDTLKHVLDQIPAEIVVMLEPTSPIRNNGLIDKCIQRFIDTEADSLATGFICKYTPFGSTAKRRQDIEGFFYPDGCLYIFKSELIYSGDLFGKKKEMVYTSREENIEIDDELDFLLADQVLRKRRLKNDKIEK